MVTSTTTKSGKPSVKFTETGRGAHYDKCQMAEKAVERAAQFRADMAELPTKERKIKANA